MGLSQIFGAWKKFKRGQPLNLVGVKPLKPGIHGVTRVRGGKVHSVDISDGDPVDRQSLALVHELLHVHTFPKRMHSKQDHRDIHVLAAGLDKHIFPQIAEEGSDMYDEEEEMAALALLDGDFYDDDDFDGDYWDDDVVVNDDDYGFEYDDEGDFWEDDDNYDDNFSWKKFRRKVLPKIAKVALPGVGHLIAKKMKKKQHSRARKRLTRAKAANAMKVPQKQPAKGAMKDMVEWGGWIMPAIQTAFSGKTLLVPRRGVVRAAPTHNIYGWKAPTWAAFWSQLIQSLEAGNNRTLKEFQRATAVAAVNTVVTFATARSIGAIVRLSDSITNADNASIQVRHFNQAGATEIPYIVDISLDKGVAEYLVIHGENDRGGGVPTSREDHQVQVDADGMRPGMVLSIESVNLRELQA